VSADFRADLKPEGFEALGDERRRPRLLEGQLGIGMQVAADGDEIGQDFLDDGGDPPIGVADLRLESRSAGGGEKRNQDERSDDAMAVCHDELLEQGRSNTVGLILSKTDRNRTVLFNPS